LPARGAAAAVIDDAAANATASLNPVLVASISIGFGLALVGSSPVHLNIPITPRIARYSLFARMQGGSESSSVIGLLLDTIIAPVFALPSASLAAADRTASSPFSDQLSYDNDRQEQ